MPQTPGLPDHAAPEYETVSPRAIEPKTKAATVGAGSGAVVAQFVDYVIDEVFYGGFGIPPEVPIPVTAFITLAVTAAGAFVGGYYARHVNRVQMH